MLDSKGKLFFILSGFDDEKDIMNSFYLILMEDVSNHYYQDTGMTKIQAENLMEALAKFHATHWRKEKDNSNCPDERGTFWVLSRRKPLGTLAPKNILPI